LVKPKLGTELIAETKKVTTREAGAGLWADKHAIPPWEWRKMPKAERDTVRKAVTIGVE
jgi:hypothetical protein